MPKAPNLPSLNLGNTKSQNENSQPLSPPMSPRSPGSIHSGTSNPGTPRLADLQARTMFAQATNGIDAIPMPQSRPQNAPNSPKMVPLPQSPPSPSTTRSQHGRDPSKSFFSNLMASKSSHKLHSSDVGITESSDRSNLKSRASSKERGLHGLKSKGSTPELPRVLQNTDNTSYTTKDSSPSLIGLQNANEDPQLESSGGKRGKSRFGGILNRTKSTKQDDGSKFKARSPTHLNIDTHATQSLRTDQQYALPIRTAPIPADHREKAFGDEAGSSLRNRSADRSNRPRQDEVLPTSKRDRFPRTLAMSHSFMTGLQQTGNRMGDRLERAGKGIFEKMTRSSSTTERELVVVDENYVCSVINLPLVKQTRKTRIARRLELSKDKTEFWMPALPWRCIE